MDEPPPNKNNFVPLFIFLIAFCVFCFSCSENKVEISSAQANVVFDYGDEGKPSQHLSFFTEVSSNVRRLESISITHGEYTWQIENPFMFQEGGKSWAGYMHLNPPPHLKKIPKGQYSFECVDAAGEKAEGSFYIDYDEELLDAEFSDEKISGRRWNERVAVFSETAELLYFDKLQDGWNDDERIFSYVKNSDFLRHIYESGSTMCIANKVYKLTPERKQALEQEQRRTEEAAKLQEEIDSQETENQENENGDEADGL